MQIQYDPNFRLGQGGYGSVFPGTFNARPAAVKRVALIDTDHKEEKALQELDHSNVVKLYHVEINDEFKYFALELCNASLDQLFLKPDHPKKYKGPKLPHQFTVLLQLASGLEHIHSKKLIHRDIKPENVLISCDKEEVMMKWADFGLSKFVNERGTFTMSRVKGTERWMAPEILKILNELENGDEVDIRQRGTVKSDIFSEGLVFGYFLSDGKHPYGIGTKIPTNILENMPVNVDNGIQSVHARELILQMLEKEPDIRITSSDVVEKLNLIIPMLQKKEAKLFTLLMDNNSSVEEIEDLLKEGVDINCVNQQGQSPLLQLAKSSSVRNNLIDLIRLLIDKGANVNYKDEDGWNVIHFLCRLYRKGNLIEIIQLLIQKQVELGNSINEGEDSILHILFKHNWDVENLIDIMKLILENGINVNCLNNKGWNSLHYYCHYCKKISIKVIQLLIEHGIDINCKNNGGWNALHILTTNHENENLIAIIQLLIEHKIDINCKNNGGWNALHILTQNYKKENLIDIIQLLIENGIDINCKNKGGWNALHILSQNRHNYKNENLIDIMQLLITHGIDINCKTDEGCNALHILCKNFKNENLIDIIKFLIGHGIDINCRNNQGDDPVQLLYENRRQRNSFSKIVKFLKSK